MSNRTPLLDACPPRPIAQAGDQYAADIIRGLSEELATSETAADFLDTTHLTKDTADFLRMAMDRIALDATAPAPLCTSCTAATAAAKPTACYC